MQSSSSFQSADFFLSQVTVVIVTYNSAHCVSALAKGLQNAPNIVVVDNASQDAILLSIKEHLPQAQLIQLPQNKGYGVANNIALAKVQTPFALLLNPDCEITPNALAQLVEQALFCSDATLFVPQLLDANGQAQINYSFPRHFGAPKTQGASGILNVGYACAAVMLINMNQIKRCLQISIIQSNNLKNNLKNHSKLSENNLNNLNFDYLDVFDSRFFLYYEDEDLCLRVFQNKGQILVLPEITVTHLSRGSVKGPKPWKSEYWRGFHHAQSKIIFLSKHQSDKKAHQIRRKMIVLGAFHVLLRLLLLSPKHLARAFGRWRGVLQFNK